VHKRDLRDGRERSRGRVGFGYGILGRGQPEYFLPRKDGESLEDFKLRAAKHAGEPYGGEVLLMVISFVPAKDGAPAWKNGVGPT
jgi:hypothetical protein